jgi:hypothetical protein
MEGLLIRSLTEADRDLLAALASRVSPQSMISRFHGAVASVTPLLLDRLLDLAPGQREALIALDDQEVVGSSCCVGLQVGPVPPGSAGSAATCSAATPERSGS